jgi:signal transduction histidine kinase/FixJ family two-component response regulator
MVSLAMIGLSLGWRRTAAVAAVLYGAAHTGMTALAGLAWGVGAVLAAGDIERAFTLYTLALGGTALGAVSSQHALPRSCYVSIWTSIPLLALAHASVGADRDAIALALMVLLYGALLSALAGRLNAFLSQNRAMADALAEKIGALTRAKAALEEAHMARSGFLAQASHDLRQPVHAIGLFVEYLSGLRIGRDGREVLANMDRALDVGRVKPVIAPVALNDVLGEVVRQAMEGARQRGITLRYVQVRAWVATDAALLHMMVQNLVSNAVKYAPGARILVGVRRQGGMLRIAVLDTGPGIQAADQTRIFQEFVRLDAGNCEHVEGLGLGLSIVRRLGNLLRLETQLVSQHGKGSCFSISGLVAVAPESSLRMPSRAPSHEARLNGLRVLVVDDDLAVRESTARLLARWGCTVRACARAQDALLLEDRFDFLICDHDTGEYLSGGDLILRLRARAGRDIAAAIITGSVLDSHADAWRKNAVTILAKPVRPAQLRSVLLTAVSAQTSPSSAAIAAAAERDDTLSARNRAET